VITIFHEQQNTQQMQLYNAHEPCHRKGAEAPGRRQVMDYKFAKKWLDIQIDIAERFKQTDSTEYEAYKAIQKQINTMQEKLNTSQTKEK